MSGVFTFMRILFLVVDFLAANGGTHSSVESGANIPSLPPEQSTALLHTKVAAIAPVKAVHDLGSSWCSTYRSSDPERLAALEMREIEIVDRFGEWHHLVSPKARVHFWQDGFGVVLPPKIETVQRFENDTYFLQAIFTEISIRSATAKSAAAKKTVWRSFVHGAPCKESPSDKLSRQNRINLGSGPKFPVTRAGISVEMEEPEVK